jgi:polyisoprenoid-binding protein YceI
MRILVVALASLVAAVGFPGSRSEAAVFRVDPEASELVVRLFKAGIGSALAHDHIVRASRFSGSVEADPKDPAAGAVAITVDAASIEADEPELREKYGLASAIRPADRQKIQVTMEGESQLDVAEYPRIELRSTAIERRRGNGYAISAELTLHGRTRQVTFPAEVAISGKKLTAKGSFRFAQTDFGIEPYSAALGAVRNKDEVELIFHLVAISDRLP